MRNLTKLLSRQSLWTRYASPDAGAALMSALLVTIIITGLGVSAITLTTFDSEITANDRSATQAFYLAEGGVQHAIALLKAAGGADDGLDDELGTNSGVMLNDVAFGGGLYTVTALDNNDDGDQTTDSDDQIFIRSVGRQNGAVSVIQVGVTASVGAGGALGGIITEDDLAIPGDATVTGACGNVHSNGDIDVSGNPTIDQDLTAQGVITIGGSPTVWGDTTPGAPAQDIPYLNPADYASYATYQLRSNGNVYDANGTLVADETDDDPWYGWIFTPGGGDNGAGKWDLSSDNTVDGMLYLEGDVTVSSNDPTWATTLVATGSIELSGNFGVTNYQNGSHPQGVQNLLFVAGLDLKINGNPDQSWAEGVMAAGEQIGVSGNPALEGALIASDVSNTSPTIINNEISGVLGLNCTSLLTVGVGGSTDVTITAWQDVRN